MPPCATSADEAGSGGGSGGAGATVVNNSSLKGKSLAFRDMPKVNMSLNLGDRLGGSAGSGVGAGGAGSGEVALVPVLEAVAAKAPA